MQHLVGVRLGQCIGHRIEHAGGNVEGKRARELTHEVGQRDAIDVLHDEIRRGVAVIHLEIVHAHNMVAGKQCGRARLGKTGNVARRLARIIRSPRRLNRIRPARGVRPPACPNGRRIPMQHFDGHTALDTRVPRHLHHAISATTRLSERAISVQDEIFHPCNLSITIGAYYSWLVTIFA